MDEATSTEDIEKQENQIFANCLEGQMIPIEGNGADTQELLFNPTPLFAKLKARQQLCISEDSPFNYLRQREEECTEVELKRLQEEKAGLLRKETDDIKQQLEFVKSKLNELNKQREVATVLNDNQKGRGQNKNDEEGDYLCDKHWIEEQESQIRNRKEVAIQTSQKNGEEKDGVEEREDEKEREVIEVQSLRPLTGKTDCPNCSCDRKRQSVCDNCLKYPFASRPKELQTPSSDTRRPSFIWRQKQQQKSKLIAIEHQQSSIQRNAIFSTTSHCSPKDDSSSKRSNHFDNSDDRPIKPAPEYREQQQQQQSNQIGESKFEKVTVDYSIVPNKIYTIGKSLNDKRSKLAQAIEELQSMIEKVKMRGNRLEQERKVAQLYKQQWRYGPTIGGAGCGAISGAALSSSFRKQNYSSRFDPNLMRDTNALMGFQNVSSPMKLRQYSFAPSTSGGGRGVAAAAATTTTAAQQVNKPIPRPRFKKMAAQTTVASRAKMVDKYNQSKQIVNQQSQLSVRSRSKSFESLHSIAEEKNKKQQQQANERIKTTTIVSRVINHNFPNGKSASDTNLSAASSPESTEIEEEIEEKIEEQEEENGFSGESKQQSGSTTIDADNLIKERVTIAQSKSNGDAMKEGKTADTADLLLVNETSKERVQKMTWIPVFGETEIRTVTKRKTTPKRKVQILPSQSSNNLNQTIPKQTAAAAAANSSILRTSNQRAAWNQRVVNDRSKSVSGSRIRSKSGDRVLDEASKKLQYASNLLNDEHRDSCTKNQLTIKRNLPPFCTRPQAKPRLSKSSTSSSSAANNNVASNTNGNHSPRASYNKLTRAKSALNINRTVGSKAPREFSPDQSNKRNPQEDTTDDTTEVAQHLIFGATKEISRLEKMIGEQQRALNQLVATTSAKDRIYLENDGAQIVGRCLCSCCSNSNLTTPPSSVTTTKSKASLLQCKSANYHHHQHHKATLIHNLKEKLNKTKARLAKSLGEEKAKHKQLEQRVDLSLRKQSDLENENNLLKKSLNNCIDTCLHDISSTFESLSDTLNDSIVVTQLHDSTTQDRAIADEREQELEGVLVDKHNLNAPTATTFANSAASPTPSASTNNSTLTNAAQLISDNRHLKRMKSHIETIERQRRCIFEELSNEKQRSQKLELELKKSKEELDQLVAAKQRLENQLGSENENARAVQMSETTTTNKATNQFVDRQQTSELNTSSINLKSAQPSPPSTTEAAATGDAHTSTNKQFVVDDSSQAKSLSEENSSTFNSIDIYRRYIQSLSPDLDAIRKERQMILSEFDNIKKMLIDMDR